VVVSVRLSGLRSPVSVLAGAYGFLALAEEAISWQPQLATKVIGGALVLAVAVSFVQGRRPERPPIRSLVLPIALLAAWCGLSLTWTLDVEATRVRSIHLGFEALLIAALALAPDRERVLRALSLGLGAGAVILSLGFLAALGEPHGARLMAFGAHANLQGREIVLGVLALGLLGRQSSRVRLATAVAGGVGIGLSFSAGTWLATVAAASVLAVRREHRSLVAALLGGIVVGTLLLTAAGQSDESRLRSPATALQGNAVEEIGSGRLVLWGHAARMTAAHPVLGVGAGAFPTALEEVRADYQRAGGEHTKPSRRSHSVYLDLLAETGPLALVLFLTPLGLALRSGWTHRDHVVLALVTFVVVSGSTDSLLHQKSLWLAVALACLAAGRRR
jgi:O-antigen ligase